MNPNPIFDNGLDNEDDEASRHPARHEASRTRWPDDGLPARFATERQHSPLHPFGLIGAVMGRR